jgi:hypothetical protein
LGGNSAIAAVVAGTLALEKGLSTVIVDNASKQSRINNFFQNKSKTSPLWESKGGVNGVLQLARVDKLTDTNIKNYARTLVKSVGFDIYEDRFECENDLFEENKDVFMKSIKCLNEAYDVVCFDIGVGISNDLSNLILERSDIIVVSLNQNKQLWSDMLTLISESSLFLNKQIIFVIGRYDYRSRVKVANLKREFRLKNTVAIPYNIDFMDSCNAGKVIEYLLRNYKCSKNDDNYGFIEQVNELVEVILEMGEDK